MLINEENTELYSIWKIGSKLCGHPHVIHGGLINTLFVESATTLFRSYNGYYDNNLSNCRVLYLAPTLPNQTVVITVKLKKIENEQFYYYCQMHTDTVFTIVIYNLNRKSCYVKLIVI